MGLGEMGAFLSERFTSDLFRMETLSLYRSDSDGDDVIAYLRGDPRPASGSAWLDRLRTDSTANPPKRWRKVHVVRGALSDYERYEFEWGFQDTVAAGEDVRVLDVSDLPELADRLVDFYVVDTRHVIAVRYDGGRFDAAEAVEGLAATALIAVRDLAWHQAVPFGKWWQAHPQFHRPAGAA